MASTAVKTSFGRWTINATTAALEMTIPNTAQTYQVPLETMTDSATILDWVFQVAEKTWATSADVGDFVRAIEHLFGRGVAGFGKDSPFDPLPILARKLGIKFPADSAS